MVMGLFAGTLSLVILFGAPTLTLSRLLLAAAVSVSYFAAMVLASLFAGVAWFDPDFAAGTWRALGLTPQQLVTYVLAGLCSPLLRSRS